MFIINDLKLLFFSLVNIFLIECFDNVLCGHVSWSWNSLTLPQRKTRAADTQECHPLQVARHCDLETYHCPFMFTRVKSWNNPSPKAFSQRELVMGNKCCLCQWYPDPRKDEHSFWLSVHCVKNQTSIPRCFCCLHPWFCLPYPPSSSPAFPGSWSLSFIPGPQSLIRFLMFTSATFPGNLAHISAFLCPLNP